MAYAAVTWKLVSFWFRTNQVLEASQVLTVDFVWLDSNLQVPYRSQLRNEDSVTEMTPASMSLKRNCWHTCPPSLLPFHSWKYAYACIQPSIHSVSECLLCAHLTTSRWGTASTASSSPSREEKQANNYVDDCIITVVSRTKPEKNVVSKNIK